MSVSVVSIVIFWLSPPGSGALLYLSQDSFRLRLSSTFFTISKLPISYTLHCRHAPRRQTLLRANRKTSISNNPQLEARRLVGEGMDAFRRGNIEQSIDFLDQAQSAGGPSYTPFLWQRGISYYYANRFQDASNQFRIDTRVNPRDTEEIVWDIASQLRANPNQRFPVASQLSLPPETNDPRKIMSAVYKLFRGEGTEIDLATAGHSGGAADEFYALFYLGLFCEARGETTKATSYMTQAVSTTYANGAGKSDYMTAVAKVHCKLRGWMI